MLIGSAVDRGSYVFVYNQEGKQMLSILGDLEGYTGHSVTVRRNSILYTYDSSGRQISWTTTEEKMTDKQLKDRETIVKKLKKKTKEFKDRYGKDYKSVMYATATNLAKEEHGAGDEGTDKLRKKYLKDTPGQEKKMRFKEFRSKLKEGTGPALSTQSGQEADGGHHRSHVNNISDPSVIKRLNAFLQGYAKTPVMDAWDVMNRVRVKLGVAGLHFDHPNMGDPQPMEEYPLSHFGGMKGEDNMGNKLDNDGIEEKTGAKLVLRVNFEDTPDGTIVSPMIHRVEE